MLPVIGDLRPWTDPEVVSIHRLPMHTPLRRARRQRLDGRWSLRLFDHPDRVSRAAITGAPAARTVMVPGNWTMQDTGDLPHYTNQQMPFAGPPPALPAHLPTGVYRRSFDVARSWAGQRIVLHVGGAESVHAVYVNGSFAGYGTDSRLPSEYDVTEHVRPGAANELAIVVLRYSAMSYVEDQDQWWMAGLHRSVHIEARPPVHVADVVVDADYDAATGTGLATVSVTAAFVGAPEPGWEVRTTLRDRRGRTVGRPQSGTVDHQYAALYVFRGHVVEHEFRVDTCAPWSAETPNRYELTVELCSPAGRVVETHTSMVGFRRVVIDREHRRLLVNGQPIWIFGVNRHDHHPDRGKAVTVEDMRADLLAMRAHNITAVRTAHYPNDSRWLDLCDELGMYVVAEANLEHHAFNTSMCDDPRFRSTYVARGARMVERDRNHPCVILWSLGNESGYGTNHDAEAGWIRAADPSRPLHYEGAIFHGDGTRPAGPANWATGGLAASDVVCPMYATIADVQAYGVAGHGTRPLIMCEYSHAMGNSNGSLADYWEVFEHTPGLQGGFIWEWKDHGLRRRGPDGRARLAYGGDFGEQPHDGNFVADGLMSADLEPHPAMHELAWVYRPVTVRAAGRGKLRITNRRSFTGLDDLTCRWEILLDGAVVERGTLAVPPVSPGSSVDVPVPGTVPRQAGEALLTLRWTTTADSAVAPAGHLVAWDQVELGRAGRATAVRLPGDGRRPLDLLTEPVTLCVRRATTDNDGFKMLPDLAARIGVGGQALIRWQHAGVLDRPADELVGHTETVTVTTDGAEIHHHTVEVPGALADLPRLGVRFAVPARFGLVRWYGRGPFENYPDRKAAAMLGIWEQPVDRLPYLVPQEFGLRCDTRWMELIDPRRGEVLRVEAVSPTAVHVSAVRHADEELQAASNQADVRPGSRLYVHVDLAHRGLGTASCGPDVLDRYRLRPGRFELAYRLSRGNR